jgi:hypothetical protein
VASAGAGSSMYELKISNPDLIREKKVVLDPPALAPVLDCCMEGIVIACPPVPPLYLAPEAGEPSGQGFIGTCGAPSYLASEAGEPSEQGCIDAVGPPFVRS